MRALGWRATQKAQHTKALASPQAFALTGDGEATLGVFDSPERDPTLLGPRLAEARYRDWQANGGLFPETRLATAAAPQLRLTAEEPAPKPNGTANGIKRDHRAVQILRALCEEFGDLFPEEFAAAKQYLEETA